MFETVSNAYKNMNNGVKKKKRKGNLLGGTDNNTHNSSI